MYHVSAQGVDERMLNVHDYNYNLLPRVKQNIHAHGMRLCVESIHNHTHIPYTYTIHIYHTHIPYTYTIHIYYTHIPYTYTIHIYHTHIPYTYSEQH